MSDEAKKETRAHYNAADEGHVGARKRKEQRERMRLDDARRYVMSDARGRLFVMTLLESCGVFRSSFTGNSQTFFNEGTRNVGLKLLSELEENAPREYLAMWQERIADKSRPEILPAKEGENHA